MKQEKYFNKKTSLIVSICSLIIGIFIIICAFTYIIQDRFVFYNVNDPESREYLLSKPGYSEIKFTSDNGKTYHGMMYQQTEGIAPLVIYFGGNGECSHRFMRERDQGGIWRYYSGYNVLFVDYEGYGLNDGAPHYLNIYERSLALFDYASLLPNVDSSRIVTMGYSLGTGSAVYLAANRPVAGLILAAPYANGYDIYNNILPVFKGPLKLLVKQKLPSDKYASLVT
ncbi:MAG: hypothetical protein LBG94_08160, partial [Treponema sp.]|nr:hypothetical protein [Treponema sp.]